MTENTKAVDALAECNNAGHQDYLATARKAQEHYRARPRRWELRISPQKIDMTDKTNIINVTKADDHVDRPWCAPNPKAQVAVMICLREGNRRETQCLPE